MQVVRASASCHGRAGLGAPKSGRLHSSGLKPGTGGLNPHVDAPVTSVRVSRRPSGGHRHLRSTLASDRWGQAKNLRSKQSRKRVHPFCAAKLRTSAQSSRKLVSGSVC